MVEVIADRLESNAHENFKQLVLGVTGRDKCVNRRPPRISTLRDQLSCEVDQSIKFGIGQWSVILDRNDRIAWYVCKEPCERAVRCCAVPASIFLTSGRENNLLFSGS